MFSFLPFQLAFGQSPPPRATRRAAPSVLTGLPWVRGLGAHGFAKVHVLSLWDPPGSWQDHFSPSRPVIQLKLSRALI